MKTWNLVSMPFQSARRNLVAPALLLLCASGTVEIASAQISTVPADVNVPLTQAAYLPQISQGSINTRIATALGAQPSTATPWQVALTLNGQDPTTGNQNYEIRITNTSSAALNLPVGTDGGTIWTACQNVEIDEVDISLTVAGQVMPVANLPSSHSCGAVSSSVVNVVPGASVVFQGTLSGVSLPADPTTVSAVVSVCAATYQLSGDNPQTNRSCQVPVTSNSPATVAATASTPASAGASAVVAAPTTAAASAASN